MVFYKPLSRSYCNASRDTISSGGIDQCRIVAKRKERVLLGLLGLPCVPAKDRGLGAGRFWDDAIRFRTAVSAPRSVIPGCEELLPGAFREQVGVKLERGREMLREIFHVVTSRIEMKLVGYAARNQQVVKLLRPYVESKIVIRPTIEINRQVCGLGGGSHNRKGTFPLPIFRVSRISKRASQHTRDPRGLILGSFEAGQLIDQGGTV